MRQPFFIFFYIFCTLNTWSQSAIDSTIPKDPIYFAVQEYNNSIGLSSSLYNGIIHKGYVPGLTGIPYLSSKDWLPGVVFFEGILYNDVNLKYDMVKDQLILKRPDGFGIELFSPRIKYFSVAGHSFYYFPANAVNKSSPAEGFYDQLETGKLTLYVKREKKILEIITNAVEHRIVETDKYYILKDGKYHFIKKFKSLLDLIPEKRKDIRSYMRKQNIRYKDDPEFALKKVVAFYNQ
ncbi:MAG: hypothetical protein ACJ748_00215 [Flavisolibacter sp.]